MADLPSRKPQGPTKPANDNPTAKAADALRANGRKETQAPAIKPGGGSPASKPGR
jgi:hypothetical protein